MLAWRIALRYLLAKKSHSAVNIISIVSVAGVAVATAAIVIVLSVFNGFASLAEARLSVIDPDAKLMPIQGKTIADADSLAAALQLIDGVVAAVPVVEERALAVCGNAQMPVVFKGVPESYGQVADLEGIVIDGEFAQEAYGHSAMTASAGVAINTGARPGLASLVKLYAPKRIGRINAANPAGAFMEEEFVLTGVYQVNQPEYDAEYVIIPIDAARRLLEYDSEASAIEFAFAPSANADKVMQAIAQAVGDNLQLLSRERLEEKSFRMIMIEKWVTFLMLAFIVVIAAFNIISTLSLMVIEKRQNMQTLRSLGADSGLVRSVFAWQGWLITMAGGIAGILLGAALSLAQQWGGFIKLSGDASQLLIDVYPVKVQLSDLCIVLALMAIVALCASLIGRALYKEKK